MSIYASHVEVVIPGGPHHYWCGLSYEVKMEQPEIQKGDRIAFMMKTRMGGRMFMFEGEVKSLDAEHCVIEMPTGAKAVDLIDMQWSGRRWEVLVDDHREAPRKHGRSRSL